MELNKLQIENLVKGNSERYLIKIDAPITNDGEKSIVHYISTDDVDRGFDIMDPAGCDWTDFEKTKSVFFNHDYDEVIGRNAWLKKEAHGILAKTIFSDTEEGLEKYQLHKEGCINSWSIGFRIKKGADGFTLPDAVEWESDKSQLRKILKWDLLEYSSAPLPMNPNAIDTIKSIIKSSYMKRELKTLEERLEFNSILKTYDDKIKELNELLTAKADKKDIEDLTEKIQTKITTEINITPEAFKEMLSKSLKKSKIYQT
jgi:HK97 family phage prohead protease